VTPEEFLADVAIVYTGDAAEGAFGSGRLIAPGLVLTAGHVVDYPTRQAPMRTGWKVRVVRERAQSGAWVGLSHEAELVWRGSGDVDLALLRLTRDPILAPILRPVFASYHSIGSIDGVDAAGFPQAWFAGTDTVRDYIVRGSLRIATQYGPSAPYAWSVPFADKPDDPHGWKGISGAAVCKVGSDQELYLFGTVQEVPANFSGGLLEVAQVSAALADEGFFNALHNSLGFEPRTVPWMPIPAPGPSPSVQAPAEYVDRPELTQPLLTHLLGDQALAGRTMISAVHGLGGIGKTTIAQWLVWRPEIEQRFRDGRIWVTLGREPPEALTIINDWVSQLNPEHKAKATLEAARSDLTTCLQNRSVLFVIDDVWPRRSAEVAKALLVASSRSCFLLTTRFSQLAGDPRIMATDFPLDQMSLAQAKQLITRALGRELRPGEERDTESLCTIVGGHPLALELAAARIKEGRSWTSLLSDLSAEIAHLDALEEVDDDLIEPPIAHSAKEKQTSVRASLLLSVAYLNAEGQRLFAWLGVISEDTTITARIAATLWETDEKTASRHLRNLRGAGVLKAEDSGYRMHDLMHDLAREILTAPVVAPLERDIPGLALTLPDASRQLLERYRAKTSNGLWHTLPEDGYIHDHLVQLFEQADKENELKSLLLEESTDGHCGWYWARERLGQTAGFIGDVNRIWSYANRTGAATATAADRAHTIALELHCSLIISSLNSLSVGIPTDVLLSSVKYKLISVTTALTLARQHPDPSFRVCTLLALAGETLPETRESVLDEALNVAGGINDPASRARALTEVAPRLPYEAQPGVVGDALRAARGIHSARARAGALRAIAKQLPVAAQPSVLDEALNAARGIDQIEWRGVAIGEVALLLPAVQALMVARGINNGLSRSRTLAEIAPRLPAELQPEVLSEALSAAQGIDHPGPRTRALVEIAPRLPAEVQTDALQEALNAARCIDHAGQRARALAAVSPLLPAEVQTVVLEEALRTARSIDAPGRRAEVLTAVALRLPLEAQSIVLEEALSVARGLDSPRALAEVVRLLPAERALMVADCINDAWLCARTLTEVVTRLPAEVRRNALDKALSAARRVDNASLRARALAEVCSRLPEEARPNVLNEALSAARGIDDAWFRAQALAAVVPLLTAEPALMIARGIDAAQSRAQALAELAPRLPAEAQRGVLDDALCAARRINSVESRARALAELACRLPAEAQPGVVDEALSNVRSIRDPWSRYRILAEMEPCLPIETRPSVLDEALYNARRIDNASMRARGLRELASRLPTEAQSAVLDEALTQARSVDDARSRVEALAALAPRLPPAVQCGVFDEALSVARNIHDPGTRAWALASIVQLLPAEVRPSALDEALGAARSIENARSRAGALAAVAPLLPAEAQPSTLDEALSAARVIVDRWERARALVAVADVLPTEARPNVLNEALSAARDVDTARAQGEVLAAVASLAPGKQAFMIARDINDAWSRARALAEFASRLDTEVITQISLLEWQRTIRVLAMHKRSELVQDLTAILPLINGIGREITILKLARSIICVGRWWPSLPPSKTMC
jgi:NB-ARC domain